MRNFPHYQVNTPTYATMLHTTIQQSSYSIISIFECPSHFYLPILLNKSLVLSDEGLKTLKYHKMDLSLVARESMMSFLTNY